MKLLSLSAILYALLALPVHAAQLQVRLIDSHSGTELPIYHHQGKAYVEGRPGRAYEIRLRNRSGERLLAVTSVDGVNVVSGQTAAVDQAGYVLDPWGHTTVDGWRKSLSQVAGFTFTRLSSSYAARTGRPENVGVIGVAVFREKKPCCQWFWRDRSKLAPGSAPEAEAGRSMDSAAAPQRRESLGTGHGARQHSSAQRTEFERDSSRPIEVIQLHYDSRANLIAAGVIPHPGPRYLAKPNPFPASGFVPDP